MIHSVLCTVTVVCSYPHIQACKSGFSLQHLATQKYDGYLTQLLLSQLHSFRSCDRSASEITTVCVK